MRNHGVLAGNEFSHGVGERNATAERDVILDDARFGAVFRHNQVARIGHFGLVTRQRNEQEADRGFNNRASREINVCAILDEGGIESAKSIALDIKIASKMRLD